MKKCFCLIVALLCFSLSVTAAPLTRIKGKIVDAGTNKPLDFADVLLFKREMIILCFMLCPIWTEVLELQM